MSKPIIEVCNLSKQYHIGLKEQANRTFREALVDTLAAPVRNFKRLRQLNKVQESETPDTIWALKDISFEVQPGEVVGIIGRNGAGKSTLLKILSRITEPTAGEVRMRGRVASLLEVGTGFHPELTGRENIYLNGTILGMRRAEIDRKFDEIVAFSEIEKFLDTPVKRYSSGMYVRLAFAVAAHLEPEILLVDEVLAVGDAAFQKKCLGKMGDVAKEGRTVLFVSHNINAIRQLCKTGIILTNGILSHSGLINTIIDKYISLDNNTHYPSRYFKENSNLPMQFREIHIVDNNGSPKSLFETDDPISLLINYQVNKPVTGANLCVLIKRNDIDILCSFDTDLNSQLLLQRQPGNYSYRIQLPSNVLKAGRYTIKISTGIVNIGPFEQHDDAITFSINEINKSHNTKGFSENRPGALKLPLQWELTTSLSNNSLHA